MRFPAIGKSPNNFSCGADVFGECSPVATRNLVDSNLMCSLMAPSILAVGVGRWASLTTITRRCASARNSLNSRGVSPVDNQCEVESGCNRLDGKSNTFTFPLSGSVISTLLSEYQTGTFNRPSYRSPGTQSPASLNCSDSYEPKWNLISMAAFSTLSEA